MHLSTRRATKIEDKCIHGGTTNARVNGTAFLHYKGYAIYIVQVRAALRRAAAAVGIYEGLMLPLRHPGGAYSSLGTVNDKASPCLIRRERGEAAGSTLGGVKQPEAAKTGTGTTQPAEQNAVKTDTGHTGCVQCC